MTPPVPLSALELSAGQRGAARPAPAGPARAALQPGGPAARGPASEELDPRPVFILSENSHQHARQHV